MGDMYITGHMGTLEHAVFRKFDNLKDAKEFFSESGIDVCGVEIADESLILYDPDYASKGLASPWPFRGSTAFMLGNEGTGLTPSQLEICDYLTYIPQYSQAIASLNVAVSGSIVMQHFGLFA